VKNKAMRKPESGNAIASSSRKTILPAVKLGAGPGCHSRIRLWLPWARLAWFAVLGPCLYWLVGRLVPTRHTYDQYFAHDGQTDIYPDTTRPTGMLLALRTRS